MVSDSVRGQLRAMVTADPSIVGTTQNVALLAAADIDSANKGQIDLNVPEAKRKVSDQQVAWLEELRQHGQISTPFNWGLFTYGASSRPEASGLGVAMVGSAYMMLIVLIVALPIGVAASIYLEEFAPKNRVTDIIEININNLAAVPSIVFGLLGLAVFINFAGLPRSAPIVGGLVLSLMTLPTIIIATRAALRSVPPSIRSAALGLGASRMQMVFHHVLPLAMPGVLTGTIIGLARALGETAPLLLIGMVAFVADYPATPLQPATALPVQIYMWSNEAERAFVERTSGGIIVLLVFLAVMNLTAIILRKRFERRW
jgi:phosphate transport system permease protein